MCLGLAVPAFAEGPKVLLEHEYGYYVYGLTLSEYVSKGTANFKYHSAATESFTYDEYVVNPGAAFTVQGVYLSFSPCRYENGDYVKGDYVDSEGFTDVLVYTPVYISGTGFQTDTVSITAEYAGYWWVHAYEDGPDAYFLLHVTGDPVHPSQTAPASVPDPVPAPAPVPNFTDVSQDSPYADAIDFAVRQGITKGTSDTTFSPSQGCTNAQILTFLWRQNGEPEPTIANPFTNSIPDAYAKAAVWAYEQGMVSGTTFDVDKPCTRAMTVAYLWINNGSPEREMLAEGDSGVPYVSSALAAKFTDVPADASYRAAVAWAVEWGITQGTSETTFSPDETCTRGQIVTFIYRNTP